jgi:uncharacterized cupin superfamily protein
MTLPPEDGSRTVLGAGDCAASPKSSVYLEVGSRHPDDLTTCSDIDLMSSSRDGRFVSKAGEPYP